MAMDKISLSSVRLREHVVGYEFMNFINITFFSSNYTAVKKLFLLLHLNEKLLRVSFVAFLSASVTKADILSL